MEEAELGKKSGALEADGEVVEKKRPYSNGVGTGSRDNRRVEDVHPGIALTVKNTLTIARREVRATFDSLVGFVVVCGSLLGIGISFFWGGGFWDVNRATMQRLFEFMPWALATVVIPLLTMRAVAEEKRSGTVELLITLPVTDAQVILGKYFAALFVTTVLLAITLLYPVAMFVWPWHLGALDWGTVWAGYTGLFLFAAAGIGVGMAFSSITESQIIAFFATCGTLAFMQVMGMVVESAQGPLGDVLAFVSFQARFQPFARGLIDTRAVVYFLSIAVLTNLWAFRNLESRKWS